MAVTAHGATFTFTSDRGTFSGGVTRITVDSPTAEVVDMTSVNDVAHVTRLVPTGSWRGGSVTVEFISGGGDPQTLVTGLGQLALSSSGLSVTKQVVLESSSVAASVGDVVKGSLKFVMTDYYG